MKCPRCGANDDRVVDSRESGDGRVVRRRRECVSCGLRFTTYERSEETPLRVVKKDGERVAFDRGRILGGMLRACEKLDVPIGSLEAATARIEQRCQEEFDREVPSAIIGNLVMEELRKLNRVAYVRFASVYREFSDVSQFLDEVRPMLGAGFADAPLDPVDERTGERTGERGPGPAVPPGPPRRGGYEG